MPTKDGDDTPKEYVVSQLNTCVNILQKNSYFDKAYWGVALSQISNYIKENVEE